MHRNNPILVEHAQYVLKQKIRNLGFQEFRCFPFSVFFHKKHKMLKLFHIKLNIKIFHTKISMIDQKFYVLRIKKTRFRRRIANLGFHLYFFINMKY